MLPQAAQAFYAAPGAQIDVRSGFRPKWARRPALHETQSFRRDTLLDVMVQQRRWFSLRKHQFHFAPAKCD
jgi:hypothetical protein